MTRVVVVDLGTGNLRSVSKAVAYVSHECEVDVTDNVDAIKSADYMILPGQGAIGTWFKQLEGNPDLKQAVVQRLGDGPVLGICLGLQALYSDSEENGGTKGLDLFPGKVRHFSGNSKHANGKTKKFKIPHMGWNQVKKCCDHPLWQGIDNDERFYFVHSYYVESANQQQVMGECEYGNTFTAAAGEKNIFATQFHPEKSQAAGLKLLKNFINWNGSL